MVKARHPKPSRQVLLANLPQMEITLSKTETPNNAPPSVGSTTASGPSTELSLSELKAVAPGKNRENRAKKKNAVLTKKSKSQMKSVEPKSSSPQAPEHAVDSVIGQQLYEKAVKAYRRDDWRTALELFDRYLADNSGSPLAADANLYKAECYLKLSAQ